MSAAAPAVAITGLGVISPLGDRPEAVAEALRTGRAAFAPLAGAPGAVAAVPDFDAARYAAIRGLRLYSRATRMAISAVQLALTDAGLAAGAISPEELGTITACTLGHIETLLEYDRSVATQGPLRGNPALMLLSLPSSPGAAVALSFGAKAFSMALAGASAGLDALGLAARMLAAGRARVCLVVGAFGLSPELGLAASRAGWLAPEGAPRPFDRRRSGTALGEGAVAFVLERTAEARSRGAAARVGVAAHAAAFAPEPGSIPAALARACADALAAAGGAVDLVSAGASGAREGDLAEALALRTVLAGAAVPITAVKSCLGESYDAGGLFQCLAAIDALASARLPPIRGLEEPELDGLAYLRAPEERRVRRALVTTTSLDGACSAAVLSRLDER
jgi:3-oxoacyl-[acyl-carrier-protein] synthase II